MSSTLRVVLDRAGSSPIPEVGRYSEQLAQALAEHRPDSIDVKALSSAVSDEERLRIAERIPGLDRVHFTPLALREQRQAWVHSVTSPRLEGFIHATSPLAPLRSHDSGDAVQYVVTVHGLEALECGTSQTARWLSRAVRRAKKYADGVVVPTAAVAEQLIVGHGFDERRVRVIAGAVPTGLHRAPLDASARAIRLNLPEEFLLVTSTERSALSVEELVQTIASDEFPDIPVVHVGSIEWDGVTLAELIVAAGIPAGQVTVLGDLDDQDLATVYERATAVLLPDEDPGFALPLLTAMHWSRPIVHTASSSLDEIAGGTTRSVPRGKGHAAALASEIADLLDDRASQTQLSLRTKDRVGAYSWSATATQIWRLHEEL